MYITCHKYLPYLIATSMATLEHLTDLGPLYESILQLLAIVHSSIAMDPYIYY